MPQTRDASLIRSITAIGLFALILASSTVLIIAPAEAQSAPIASPADEILTALSVERSTPNPVPANVAAKLPAEVFTWLSANNWNVEWLQGPGPGRFAEARYGSRTIVVWETADRSTDFWAGAFAHELGHAVSYVHLTRTDMQDWTTMRGLPSWSWQPGMPSDFSVGEGDFAEAFMSYLLGHQVRSDGGPLTAKAAAFIAANTPF